jgi:TetR/AcrR family transcriptional repressor of nem operon
MQERARRTREELVAAMQQSIHRRGVTRTSLSEVLAATGAKKGSLYFHFADKDELALAALERAAEDFVGFTEKHLRGETPAAQLRAFLSAIRRMHRDTDFVRGCIFGNTALETADDDPRYRELLRGVFEGWVTRLTAVVGEAQARGEVRADLAPRALARQMVTAVEGGVMQARLWRSEEPLAESLTTLEGLMGLAPAPNEDEVAEHD